MTSQVICIGMFDALLMKPSNLLCINRVVIFDARSDFCTKIKAVVGKNDNVEIYNELISAKKSDCDFFHRNIISFSADSEVINENIFPGLCTIKIEKITPLSLPMAIRKYGIDTSHDTELHINVYTGCLELLEECYSERILNGMSKILILFSDEHVLVNQNDFRKIKEFLTSLYFDFKGFIKLAGIDYYAEFEMNSLKEFMCKKSIENFEYIEEKLNAVRDDNFRVNLETQSKIDVIVSYFSKIDESLTNISDSVRDLTGVVCKINNETDKQSNENLEIHRSTMFELEELKSWLSLQLESVPTGAETATLLINSKLDLQIYFDKKVKEIYAKHQTIFGEMLTHANLNMLDDMSKMLYQIESLINLYRAFDNNDSFFHFHGWPIGPDLAYELAKCIFSNNYSHIFEFGSGTSSMVMATALKTIGGSPKCTITSFEHSEKYYTSNTEMACLRGLNEVLEIKLTPLIKYVSPDCGEYLFYDVDDVFHDMAVEYNRCDSNLLFFVDGPPGKICKNSRFPSLLKIIEYFGLAKITIILDDYNRVDEKETVSEWVSFLNDRKITHRIEFMPFSKGCAILHINRQ